MKISITPVTSDSVVSWATLCNALWPHKTIKEMIALFQSGEYNNEYLLEMNGEYLAMISLSVRNDYVEGKFDSNPVGYLEGIYVKPAYRKKV